MHKKKSFIKKNDTSYWISGYHTCLSAINNDNRKIEKILISEKKYYEYIKELSNSRNYTKQTKKILKVKEEKLNRLFGKQINTQGIALLTKQLEFYDLNKFFELSKTKLGLLSVLLYKISDPHNLGAILRSASAFNIKNILLTKHYSAKDNYTVAKTSSGAVDHVNIFTINNLDSSLKTFQKKKWFLIGLDNNAETSIKEIENLNLSRKNILLIMGSEEKGINNIIKKNCDALVRININNSLIDSLNVSCASSIVFYELAKHV